MYHYINDPENELETESIAEDKTLKNGTGFLTLLPCLLVYEHSEVAIMKTDCQ